MAKPERDPRPLGDLLQVFVTGRGWKDRMAIGRLREAWGEIVGGQIADHSEPLRLIRGTLTIRAEPGPWASELTLLGPSLAVAVDRFLGGEGAVRQVSVVPGSSRSSGP